MEVDSVVLCSKSSVCHGTGSMTYGQVEAGLRHGFGREASMPFAVHSGRFLHSVTICLLLHLV